MSSEEEDAPMCEFCGLQLSAVYCDDCLMYLCTLNGCDSELHASKPSHKRTTLQVCEDSEVEAPAAEPNQECQFCGSATAAVWCDSCNLFLCTDNECAIDIHRNQQSHVVRCLDGSKWENHGVNNGTSAAATMSALVSAHQRARRDRDSIKEKDAGLIKEFANLSHVAAANANSNANVSGHANANGNASVSASASAQEKPVAQNSSSNPHTTITVTPTTSTTATATNNNNSNSTSMNGKRTQPQPQPQQQAPQQLPQSGMMPTSILRTSSAPDTADGGGRKGSMESGKGGSRPSSRPSSRSGSRAGSRTGSRSSSLIGVLSTNSNSSSSSSAAASTAKQSSSSSTTNSSSSSSSGHSSSAMPSSLHSRSSVITTSSTSSSSSSAMPRSASGTGGYSSSTASSRHNVNSNASSNAHSHSSSNAHSHGSSNASSNANSDLPSSLAGKKPAPKSGGSTSSSSSSSSAGTQNRTVVKRVVRLPGTGNAEERLRRRNILTNPASSSDASLGFRSGPGVRANSATVLPAAYTRRQTRASEFGAGSSVANASLRKGSHEQSSISSNLKSVGSSSTSSIRSVSGGRKTRPAHPPSSSHHLTTTTTSSSTSSSSSASSSSSLHHSTSLTQPPSSSSSSSSAKKPSSKGNSRPSKEDGELKQNVAAAVSAAGADGDDGAVDLGAKVGAAREPGVLVKHVTQGGPLWAGGVEVGDVITLMNRKIVRDPQDFALVLTTLKKGMMVPVKMMRDHKQHAVKVQL